MSHDAPRELGAGTPCDIPADRADSSRRAVFLDRDGTIIEDSGFVRTPAQVRLLPNAADAIHQLRSLGFRIVVVSNQSGVARGLLTEADLRAVHERMVALLSQNGASIDNAYYCPYLDGPDATVLAYRQDSPLRKPKPGMLLKAADDMKLNLRDSWMIGDAPRDIEAGQRAGCRTVLLGREQPNGLESTILARDLAEAANRIERYAHATR